MFIEPVFGKKFFGREEVLGTLQKRVTALKGGYRQNLALTGPMLAGKSSILRHFLKNIKDPDIIPLYVEMTGEDFQVFCTRFMATLLYRYLASEGKKADGDFKALRKRCRPLVPATVQDIDNILKYIKTKKETKAYEKLLGLTSTFKEETGKSCIVILDEFHNLSNFRIKKSFQIFGRFIMVQKSTMYIVSSSQKTLLKDILSKKLSLLFGNFEVIEIDGFDSQTAQSFISEKIGDTEPLHFIKNYLIQVTQGSPFYLEVLTNRFSSLMKRHGTGRSSRECLLNAFADLLYESEGVINQYFTNNINFFLEKASRKKLIPILLSLAHGNSTIKAVQKDLGRHDKDLGVKLKKLQEMDLVVNSGVFYKISEKLFEYWLKYVYFLKSRSMIDDMDIKYLEFKEALEADYKKYLEYGSKSTVEVICDLFKSFGGEKIKINMNSRRMPRFETVEHHGLSHGISRITGTFADKKWVCYVKQDDITDERDVWDLGSIKPENEKYKISRKIVISLKGIEQNAFLLAKDKNIWVWDLKQLNEVLRLFKKFELVL